MNRKNTIFSSNTCSLSLSFLFIFFTKIAFSQSYSISGQVVEMGKTNGLAGVAVYLNGTGYFSEADTGGYFNIKNVPAGRYQLVASMVGFTTQQQAVLVNENVSEMLISLKADVRALEEVSVKAKRDKKWEKQLKTFEDEFFGIGSLAKKCEIKNAYVIDFTEVDGVFSAKAAAPLEIENRALGYRIFYDLRRFSVSNSLFSSQGFSRYQPLNAASDAEAAAWITARNEAYIGSDRHFYTAMVNGQLKEEGFLIYVVDDKFKGNGNFSLLGPQLGKRLKPFVDSLVLFKQAKTGNFKLRTTAELEILNTNVIKREGTYTDSPYPVSWLMLSKGQAEISPKGIILDPTAVVWAGDVSQRRIATLLPLDFSPSVKGKMVATDALAEVNEKAIDQAQPVGELLHSYKGDTLTVTLKFGPYAELSGHVDASFIENTEPDFKPDGEATKAKIDTTTKAMGSFEGKTTSLEEVSVKSKKTVKKSTVAFAQADFVLKESAFKENASVTNVFTALQSRVPGVRIVERVTDTGMLDYTIDMRGSRSSSFGSNPPLLLVNGMPFSTNPQDLMAISMSDVASIEVFKRATSAFGSRGAGGAINIVTHAQVVSEALKSGGSVSKSDFKIVKGVPFTDSQDVQIKAYLPLVGLNYDIFVNGTLSDGQSFFLSKKIVLGN